MNMKINFKCEILYLPMVKWSKKNEKNIFDNNDVITDDYNRL